MYCSIFNLKLRPWYQHEQEHLMCIFMWFPTSEGGLNGLKKLHWNRPRKCQSVHPYCQHWISLIFYMEYLNPNIKHRQLIWVIVCQVTRVNATHVFAFVVKGAWPRYRGVAQIKTFRKMRFQFRFSEYKLYELNTIKWHISRHIYTSSTDLLLSRDQVPVVHKPGFQLLWDLNLHLHSVYKGLLLQEHIHIQATLPDRCPYSSVRLTPLWGVIL